MGREKQRANRRMKEEMLDLRNCYGAEDLTPYEAVKNIYFRREVSKCNSTEPDYLTISRGVSPQGLFSASTYQWPAQEFNNTCRRNLD